MGLVKNRRQSTQPAPVAQPARAARPARRASPTRQRGQQKAQNQAAKENSALMSGAMAKEDPQSAFLSRVTGAGMNPFGPTGYNDWLQNDAYGQVDAMYGMAIQSDPKLTRDAFYNSFFADPRSQQMLGTGAYGAYNAQENPRDYYNSQLQASGRQLGGASWYDQWLQGAGYDQMADAYGAAHQRDPLLTWQQFMQPSAFG
jgi:hypothetical protein